MTRLQRLLAAPYTLSEAEALALIGEPRRANPLDLAAATELVDHALKGAGETYVKLHRDRLIRDEIRFQRFVRESREAKARRVEQTRAAA